MKIYKMNEAATVANLSQSGVRNWLDNPQIEEFFSDMATRRVDSEYENAKARQFNEADLYVLATISELNPQKVGWEEIRVRLSSGYRVDKLPIEAALVLPETRIEAFSMLQEAQVKIGELESRISELENQIKEEQREKLDLSNQLSKEVGRWQAKAELYKEMLDEKNNNPDA